MQSRFHVLAIALFASAAALVARPDASAAAVGDVELDQFASQNSSESSRFVERVRRATEAFRFAIPEEYQQFLGCVSGPEEGAMGVHFVNFGLLDTKLEVEQPEALIYEVKGGRARLLGVEYIVPAAPWDDEHKDPKVPPMLEGQVFHFNESPNRFRLDPFYELHVWAWRDNPKGVFADWNPRVSCDGQ